MEFLKRLVSIRGGAGTIALTNDTVILHVLPHARKLNLQRYANLLEDIPPTDTRQLEELRCLQRTVLSVNERVAWPPARSLPS